MKDRITIRQHIWRATCNWLLQRIERDTVTYANWYESLNAARNDAKRLARECRLDIHEIDIVEKYKTEETIEHRR